MAETIKIGGELESTATGNVVAAASAIKDKVKNKYQSVINAETDTTLAAHSSAINGLEGQNYVTLVATDADADIAAVFTRLSVTPAVNTVYRIANWKHDDNTTRYNVNYYSEYAANGNTTADLVPISVENKGIDDVPTAGSRNLVESGGVKKEISAIKSSLTQIFSCIQDFAGNELNITDGQGNVVFRITKDGAQSIKFINKEGNDILDGVQAVVNELGKYFQDLRGDLLYVTDNDGNVIFKINAAGAESVDFQANKRKLSEAPLGWYGNTLYVTDNEGNFVFCIDSNGIHCTKIFANSFSIPGLHNDWYDKIIATYGDSVTATNNGDFQKPFSNLDANWGNRVASYFSMYKHYGRGIGGQGYSWGVGVGDAGGSVCWLTPSGVLINRLDTFNYDDWDGETYPSGVTAEMEQQGTAIRVRGCLSSWLRITKMFPASIKDSIDIILVMAHNDTYDETPCSFVANDTTDPEWAASGSDYYGLINGDYNIDTFRGGVASTLMKLQLWMPNAVIVLMTGISGQGVTGEIATRISYPEPRNKAEGIREMSKLTSIPCIDTFANDGINGWNRTYYIADNIHPNYTYGRNMLSRAIIGGLKTILPKEQIV